MENILFSALTMAVISCGWIMPDKLLLSEFLRSVVSENMKLFWHKSQAVVL